MHSAAQGSLGQASNYWVALTDRHTAPSFRSCCLVKKFAVLTFLQGAALQWRGHSSVPQLWGSFGSAVCEVQGLWCCDKECCSSSGSRARTPAPVNLSCSQSLVLSSLCVASVKAAVFLEDSQTRELSCTSLQKTVNALLVACSTRSAANSSTVRAVLVSDVPSPISVKISTVILLANVEIWS